METNHPDQGQTGKHLKEYEAAWKNCSVEDILSFMAEDVSVSDYGLGVLNLDKSAARAYFTKVFASTGDLKITTHSINDQKDFTAWEWEVTFNYVTPLDEVAHEEEYGPAMADGRNMRMVGVSLLWWNDDGKIVKKHDYNKTVAN